MAQFWTVAQTNPSSEAVAVEHLLRRGFSTFAPMMEELVGVRRGAAVRRVVRMFPSYVFVMLSDGQPWTPICSTRGVLRLLRCGDQPGRLPPDFVSGLAIEAGERGIVNRLPPPPAPFRSGQIVFSSEGPLALFPGQFQRMTGADRCRVLFSLFGRLTSAEVEVSQLRAA